MALLTAFALNARAESQRQRAQAEGMVEFMLTDLRDRLKGVGRLDVLTAVNRKALGYYQTQDLDELAADSLERRARILLAMGADDLDRHSYDRAIAQFREAARTTAALLAEDPRDEARLFAHAQSEFWIGRVDYDRARYRAAKPAFERYKRIIDRLLQISPGKPEWLQESAYAEGNLCSIALAKPVDIETALRSCAAALSTMEQAARASGGNTLVQDIANRQAWLADAYRASGNWESAWQLRMQQERRLKDLMARDPQNQDLKDMWLTNQFSTAALEKDAGRTASAFRRLRSALVVANALVAKDPENQVWVRRKKRIEDDLRNL